MSTQNNTSYTVCALYHFVAINDTEKLKEHLLKLMTEHQIKGTLLLAKEGINGTVAGKKESIDQLVNWLKSDDRFKQLVTKESYTDTLPFYRTKVKLKKEIVTMGVEDIDPNHIVGTYVKPEQWNELISSPEVLLVDTRNDYEVSIGSFTNAANPKTKTFRQFPDYVKNEIDQNKQKKVAMFCTGGIRCEKSTAYLKQQGFEEVYHLEGGILKYLEEVPKEESLWQGECFVFDNRVSVNHNLEKGSYDQCYGCRMPITEEEKTHPHYTKGVSCHHCYKQTNADQKKRYIERERQIELAKERGEPHLGDTARVVSAQRKNIKQQIKNSQKQASQGS